jgi:protein TonB
VHAFAIATASTVVALTPAAPPSPDLIPIEMVRVDPPPEPPKPKVLVTKVMELAHKIPMPTALMPETPRASAPPVAENPDTTSRLLAGAVASPSWSLPGGDTSGNGKLFSVGDLPISGTAGGSGNAGTGGDGKRVDGKQVAVTGSSDGLTSFARPAGGYQTQPRYPDSARRQGIEGETLLRFQVLTSGRVAAVTVAQSAGHADLDRAAADAVKTWLFEPARRGKEAVAVWVTLPVRFRLQSGVSE